MYKDSGGIPDEGGQVFSGVFSVPSEAVGYFGLFDMGLVLPSGVYWASFEVKDDQNFTGFMRTGAPNRLSSEARKNAVTGIWTANTIIEGIGLRVNAEVVPIPAAIWLFGSGVLGFLGIARHKKA